MNENEIAKIIVNSCFRIHQELGPGLLESVYENVLAYELNREKLQFEKQKSIPLKYHNIKMDLGFRADIIVEDKILVELKSVEKILPVHKKQVLTYLKISNFKLGLLINFNSDLIKNGITRIVNNL